MALQEKLTSCVRRLFTKTNDMRQAYDFFSNSKVNGSALFLPHQEKTLERIAVEKSEYILAIQDSTSLNYTNHKAKLELGRIGGTRDRYLYGLIQHSTICVTEDNIPLGLIDLRFFHHDDKDTSMDSASRKIEDRHSYRWLEALKVVKEKINSTKKVINISDREGDFFEFLNDLTKDNQLFIVRVKYNRYTGEKHRHQGEKLFKVVDNEDVIGQMQVEIYDPNTKIEKPIELKLKCVSNVKLPRVWRSAGSIKRLIYQ